MNEEDQYFVLFFMPTLKICYIDFKYNVIWRNTAGKLLLEILQDFGYISANKHWKTMIFERSPIFMEVIFIILYV